MYIRNCLVGDVLGVVTCVKFQNEISGSYDYTGVNFPLYFYNGKYFYTFTFYIITFITLFFCIMHYTFDF